MEEVYPHVPLLDNLGLGIALLSYDGRIFWGFNADYDVVPDLAEFVQGTRDALQELLRAAATVEVAPAAVEGKGATPNRARRRAAARPEVG
jgi:diacylglycerol O-acyltransferase